MIPGSLVALTPGRLRGGDPAGRGAALRAIEAAVEGGVRALLVREYGLEDGPLLAFARDAASVLRSADGPTWFGMHDRAHLAAAVGADAVQLGGRSLPPEDARSVVPKGVALGLSTHAGDDPHALDGSVDFALHAP
ncbi:MAG: thiamine phosphate synthase, partial [Planctomycetota bacterium]